MPVFLRHSAGIEGDFDPDPDFDEAAKEPQPSVAGTGCRAEARPTIPL
jgi:hypothetical protein